jgi:LysM repeat protein
MHFSFARPLSLIASVWFTCDSLYSQSVVNPSAAASKIEPGLELGVNWKWWVAPPEKKEWGMPLPDALLPKTPGSHALEPIAPTAVRPDTYDVKKGDAIIKIAKKFDMTAWQLKQFNELTDDRIRIGQILRIPTPGQLLTMVPPPPPPESNKEIAGKKKTDKSAVTPEPEPIFEPGGEAQSELDNVRQQVFLDREMFSPGMIDGKSGATFLKIGGIYQRTHADAANPGLLKAKAEAALKEPYTRYILRTDDFKFIKPPKDEPVAARISQSSSARKKGSKADKADKAAPAPPQVPSQLTIDELVAADFLGYTSAWEFVAERFHCDEAFLHRINPQLKEAPVVGTEFQVPNVIPFEIENALVPPLQPVADPQKPVTAAVVVLSRLEISCEGKLIAVLPLTTARPGLHGRGSWTVLNAIPQPRMATKREPREIPKEKPAPAGDGISSEKLVIEPPLEKEQYLAPGPNNPVGIIWINLAKSGSNDPLPYGLHGTSIPAKMRLEGIGGLRLTNWDIARATRLIPAGTALQWKAQ